MNRNKFLKPVVIVAVVVVVCALVFLTVFKTKGQAPNLIEYKNEEYGFTFTLPASWNGYTIAIDKWQGFSLDKQSDTPSEIGPIIKIRNPNWTEQDPYQDIPIMVFTLDQWEEVSNEKLSVSAAPMPPTELGRNAKYVFALPARYNYSYPTGWEEVDQIIKTNPLKTFNP
jgi:hypothetical protein